MKSIMLRLALAVLAALPLVGCNQKNPSNSTGTSSANSSINNANDMTGGTTNMPATNSMPNVNTPTSAQATGAANDATR